jgi:hypothetical protein
MAFRIGPYALAGLVALAVAGCAHKAVTQTQAMKIAEFKQKVLAGVGRTSKSNGYFVSLSDDGKGKAWMKGETVSHAVAWSIRDGSTTGTDQLALCLAFGPAVNFPNGHTFCTPSSLWDRTVTPSVPPLES